MPTKPLSDELAQQALDVYEQFGDYVTAAKSLGVAKQTFRDRVKNAQVRGMRPTVRKDAPRVYQRQRLGRMHLVIPDVQAKAGVPLDHLQWIGNYIVEKKPDVIVQIGDFADMPSLSRYDQGKLQGEGRRYGHDINAVHRAMDTLLKPLQDYNRTADEKYKPELHLTMGNHEYRILREVEDNPKYEGKFSYNDLAYEDYGWKVYPFLEVAEIDGVEYSHYFTSGVL
jgi:hypothetical protein